MQGLNTGAARRRSCRPRRANLSLRLGSMTDPIVATEVRMTGEQPESSQARRQFAPPVVEDLGKLQALTQNFTIPGG